MMKRIFCCILIFFCTLFVFPQSASINKNLFGFNTSNTFTYFDVNDKEFLDKINFISPNILRFPGGNISNFYHVSGPAYGFKISEVDKWHSQKMPKRVRGLIKDQNRKGHNHNYINDYIRLIKEVNAKALVVANIITADTDEILTMIDRLKSEKIEIVGVELGCELSNRAFSKKIKDIDDYLILSKKFASKIRLNHPELKIAVVAAPIKKNMPSRIKNWNSELAKYDFFDAIIHHSYTKVISGVAEAGQMIFEESVEIPIEKKFSLYKEIILHELDIGFKSKINEYIEIFGDVEIWLTEWNLQMSKTTGNTMLQSLFVSHFMMELFSSSELKNITIASYHNLAGRDISGSIFKNNMDTFNIHSTFIPFTLLNEIFLNKIYEIEKVKINSDVFAYYCFDSENSLRLVFIINWSNMEIDISDSLDSLDPKFNIPENNNRETLVCAYFSNNLFDTNSDSYYINPRETLVYQQLFEFNQFDQNHSFLLKPHSISLFLY